ncbi:MAG TPA: response regulator transcription factor [Terriglobales bacterium]|nr:response regulator transcription factor [Terriglobales bacterium]
MERPRVLLGDDHVMFTDGLRSFLNPHVEVVGTAEDGEQVITAVQRLHPDVVILDISMPVLNGIKAARKLREVGTSSKIIFCTMQTDPAFVTEALNSGATGYVLKTAAGSEMIAAIHEVIQGRTYISVNMRSRVAGPPERD